MKYDIEDIKKAFWKTFHAQGELWFPYFKNTPKENQAATESEWEEFTHNLNAISCPDKVERPIENDFFESRNLA